MVTVSRALQLRKWQLICMRLMLPMCVACLTKAAVRQSIIPLMSPKSQKIFIQWNKQSVFGVLSLIEHKDILKQSPVKLCMSLSFYDVLLFFLAYKGLCFMPWNVLFFVCVPLGKLMALLDIRYSWTQSNGVDGKGKKRLELRKDSGWRENGREVISGEGLSLCTSPSFPSPSLTPWRINSHCEILWLTLLLLLWPVAHCIAAIRPAMNIL